MLIQIVLNIYPNLVNVEKFHVTIRLTGLHTLHICFLPAVQMFLHNLSSLRTLKTSRQFDLCFFFDNSKYVIDSAGHTKENT